MLVSNLHQFIRLLVPPLAATGINQAAGKSITTSLESLASALEPFGQMTTDQLADLLKVADEYRRTGILPETVIKKGTTPKPKAPKAPKAPKVTPAEAVATLRDIQERALSLDAGQINGAVDGLSSLTVKDLEEVQRQFLGAVIGKKKDQALAALRKKIDDSRANRERVETIRAY